MVAGLDLIIVLVAILFYRAFQAVSFDEEFAEVVGLPVDRLLLLLLALVAISVVVLIQVVGVILAIALLTIPAETARHWSHSLRGMMIRASVIGATCTTAGTLLSYTLASTFDISIPSGPLIILTSIVIYGLSHWLRGLTHGRER
jgi:zinc transport system permease protein